MLNQWLLQLQKLEPTHWQSPNSQVTYTCTHTTDIFEPVHERNFKRIS